MYDVCRYNSLTTDRILIHCKRYCVKMFIIPGGHLTVLIAVQKPSGVQREDSPLLSGDGGMGFPIF